MAEVAVDERRLLKTIRWWDGFVIGLANPGFLLIGLWGSILALGGTPAIILWVISALIGALQAYIYCEPAAMFPDKPGGLSVYAREGLAQALLVRGPDRRFRLLVRLVERARDLREPDRVPAHRRVRRRQLLRNHDLGPADHLLPARLATADRGNGHRPLLDLQHSRHASGRRAQLCRRGPDDHPDPW